MKGKFFVVLSILLALGVLTILGYKEDDINIHPLYQTSIMQGLHLTHKEGDKVKWDLVAKNATFPKGNKEIIINSLELKIHDDPEIYLTGESGTYKIEERVFTINKPIEINIKDAKFRTDSLTWNSKKGLITTEDNIKFSGKNFLIEGTGLVARVKQQKVKILKNVKGTFYR